MKKNFFVGALLLVSLAGNAQSSQEELAQLMRDDSVDVNTIALYPQNVREIIFQVSTHPEGVAKLSDFQKKSNEAFKNLIASYSKEEQQKIWNLTRYDMLIEQLAATKEKKKKVENVLKNFPAEIHDDAYDYAVNHHELIISIGKLNKDFDSSLINIIANYSPDDQSAFRRMLSTPEAFSLLNENMHLTVRLGDIYKTNPVLVRQQFDSLNLVAAEQTAREKEEWKKEMQQNPDAQNEMKQSASEYAKENGYNENNYANTDPNVVEHYVYVPYPYWCGYPLWHEYDYWYPYPYWYHWGFYFWNGDIFWLGPPLWYFVYWHFHHHHHFYDYPHLTNVYINHYYYSPRGTPSQNSAEVHRWMKQNETSLPRDFRTNTEQRINRIREFGKSEIDREKFNEANPAKNVTRDDFMKQHVDEYPHLKPPVVVEQPPPALPKVAPSEEKPKKKPVIQPIQENRKINIENTPKPSPPPREKVQPKPREITPQTQPQTQPKTPAQIPAKPVPAPVQPKKEQPKSSGKGGNE